MNVNRTSLLYSTLLLTGVSVAVQLIGFGYRIALSRMIGAETMGLYQLIMPVYSVLLSLTVSGLTVGVSTLSSEYHARGNHRAVRRLLTTALRTLFVLWLPLAAVTVTCSDAISVCLLGDARTQLGLILLPVCLLLTGVENLHKHHFYGMGNVAVPAAVELGEQLVRAAAVLGLLAAFLPQYPERVVGLIVLGMAVSEVFSSSALMAIRRGREGHRGAPAGPGESPGVLRGRLLSAALPIGATALLGNLMGCANSVLIPQRLVQAGVSVSDAISSFGVLFGMTLPLLTLPSAFIGAMCTVLVPRLTEYVALGNRPACRDRIGKALLATSVLILPVTAFLVVLGPTVGGLLFQDERVGLHILPLAVGVVLCSYQSVLGACLNGVGLQRRAAAVSLLCGGVQLAFTWLGTGIPGVGLYGFIAGFVVSSAIAAAALLAMVIRSTGLRLELFGWFAAPGLAALLMGLCVNLLFRVLVDQGLSGPAAVGGCLAFGLLLYLVTLWVEDIHPLKLFHLGKK